MSGNLTLSVIQFSESSAARIHTVFFVNRPEVLKRFPLQRLMPNNSVILYCIVANFLSLICGKATVFQKSRGYNYPWCRRNINIDLLGESKP